MSKRKVLMARREDPEVEAILKDASQHRARRRGGYLLPSTGRGVRQSPRGCRDYLRRDP